MHGVARSQLARLGIDEGSSPPVQPWRAFLDEVSRRYAHADALQECVEEGILVVDGGRVAAVNERFRTLWSVPHVDVRSSADEAALWMATRVNDPVEFLVAFRRSIGEGGAVRQDVTLSDGRVLDCCSVAVRDADQGVLGRVWSYRDVTAERRLATERRAVTARMASVGRIVGEVAHAINNPLAYVAGNVEHVHDLAKEALDTSGPLDRVEIVEALGDARAGIERISTFIRDLRVLAGIDDEDRAPTDPRATIEAAIGIIEARHPARVRWRRKLDAVPPVLANEARLTQVFVNILDNAAQAGSEPTITIATTTADDGAAAIEIVDTGRGIAPADLERVFDPFFTTRGSAGTGLGLSIAKTVVEWLGGRIRIETPPDGGTTVRVELPAAAA